MSYYARPMGDYKTYGYAGDPGFLSSLWKGVKSIAKVAIGTAIGGPIGGVIAGTAGGGGGGGGAPTQFPVPAGTIGGAVTFPGGMRLSTAYTPMTPGQGRLPPFTARGAGVLPAGGRGGTMVPSGYHFAKDGSGKLVRNRRMNVANPRALRRSMRRVQGFEKLARRTITFTRRTRMKKRKSS